MGRKLKKNIKKIKEPVRQEEIGKPMPGRKSRATGAYWVS